MNGGLAAAARAAYDQGVLILLTNDDGIYAPGLQALRKELLTLGDVVVCAPATEQSAAGTLRWMVQPSAAADAVLY